MNAPNQNQKPNRGGAPRGNANRMTHALRASKLPKDAKAEENAGYALRRLLMEALEAQHGKGRVPVAAQALVQTAHRHEMRARLAARWLRQGKDLTLAERLNLLETISTASESRDKIILQLGLTVTGKSSASIWDALNDQESPGSPIRATGHPAPSEASTAAPAGQQRGSEKQEPPTYDPRPWPQANEALALLTPDGDAHHAEPISKDSPTGQEAAPLLSQAGGSATGDRPPEAKASEGEAA